MLVSIILTTYKRPIEVFRQAVYSVLEQSYKSIELIIINDDPNSFITEDDVNKLIKDKCPFKYIVNSTNIGACLSRNKGVELSSGEIIGFLDDDDEWEINKIEKMVNHFEDNIGLVYCDFTLCYPNKNKYISFEDNLKNINTDIMSFNCIGGCSIPLMRKDIFYNAGRFDPNFQSAQDLDLWIRIIKITDVALVKESLVNYHFSGDAITRDLKKRLQGYDALKVKYKDDYAILSEQKSKIVITELQLCGEYRKYTLAKKYIIELHGIIDILKGTFFFIKGLIKSTYKRESYD